MGVEKPKTKDLRPKTHSKSQKLQREIPSETKTLRPVLL